MDKLKSHAEMITSISNVVTKLGAELDAKGCTMLTLQTKELMLSHFVDIYIHLYVK